MSFFGGGGGGGAQNSGQPGGGGLFGSGAAQNTTGGGGLFGAAKPATGGGGLFGSNTTQPTTNTGGGGLFGSSTAPPASTGGSGLFGSSTNQPTNTGGSGLFGSNTTQNATGSTAQGGSGLFGASTAKPAGSGLFGAAPSQPTQTSTGGGGLFGASTTQAGSGGGGGLFGSSTTQAGSGGGGGLFGSSTTQTRAGGGGSGLFGGSTAQNTTQGGLSGASTTQPQSTGSNLFGSTLRPTTLGAGAAPSLYNNTTQSQNLRSSLYQPDLVSVGNMGHTMTREQYQLIQTGGHRILNEKSVPEQIQTLYQKWDPEPKDGSKSQTPLRTYLYNSVPKAYAPFYYPQPGESEKTWEEALSRKPEMPKIEGSEEASNAYVPVECIGFKSLGARVENQATYVLRMRERLHEMNNSLGAIMDAHQQRITVRLSKAKKQHEILAQRCLRLAVKVQVLANRGYALQPAEERLRLKLLALERGVMDPGFAGREDEIWARLVAMRERTRWLEDEGKRVTAQLEAQGAQTGGAKTSGVPEDVLVKTRRILKDYEDQLEHLRKELAEVKTEYTSWVQSQRQ